MLLLGQELQPQVCGPPDPAGDGGQAGAQGGACLSLIPVLASFGCAGEGPTCRGFQQAPSFLAGVGREAAMAGSVSGPGACGAGGLALRPVSPVVKGRGWVRESHVGSVGAGGLGVFLCMVGGLLWGQGAGSWEALPPVGWEGSVWPVAAGGLGRGVCRGRALPAA